MDDYTPKPRPMTLHMGGEEYRFFGGPWDDAPLDTHTVCMLEMFRMGNIPRSHVPVPDYGRAPQEALEAAAYEAWRAALRGEEVYVGCGWGRGRTGLLMAGLVALSDESGRGGDPVKLVRELYLFKALETPEQEAQARTLASPWRRFKLRAYHKLLTIRRRAYEQESVTFQATGPVSR